MIEETSGRQKASTCTMGKTTIGAWGSEKFRKYSISIIADVVDGLVCLGLCFLEYELPTDCLHTALVTQWLSNGLLVLSDMHN